MRTFRFVGVIIMSGLGAGSAAALDPNLSPSEAFRSGYEAYKAGDKATALEALGFAADKLHPAALWKLGRMYATGDLVDQNDKKALEMFATVANEYADGNPHGPDAPFVADAFVTLGAYYQSGIPGEVNADPDPQYQLASMFLLGEGGDQNARQAARWFKLAARKGHVGAQSEFGYMLYEGIGVGRRPIEGLMWLSIARLSAPGDERIQARHEQVFS